MTGAIHHSKQLAESEMFGKKAQTEYGHIFYRFYGADTAIAKFFVLVLVAGSTKSVAVRLGGIEYPDEGTWKSVPSRQTLIGQVFDAKFTEPGKAEILNSWGEWETLYLWDGVPLKMDQEQ